MELNKLLAEFDKKILTEKRQKEKMHEETVKSYEKFLAFLNSDEKIVQKFLELQNAFEWLRVHMSNSIYTDISNELHEKNLLQPYYEVKTTAKPTVAIAYYWKKPENYWDFHEPYFLFHLTSFQTEKIIGYKRHLFKKVPIFQETVRLSACEDRYLEDDYYLRDFEAELEKEAQKAFKKCDETLTFLKSYITDKIKDLHFLTGGRI